MTDKVVKTVKFKSKLTKIINKSFPWVDAEYEVSVIYKGKKYFKRFLIDKVGMPWESGEMVKEIRDMRLKAEADIQGQIANDR
jgi:hypothetical protein